MVQVCNKGMDFVLESIEAITQVNAHLKQIEDLAAVYYREVSENQIPILSGGGSGHEPAHFGYVGKGMLTAAISGPIFVPPCANDILKVIRFLNRGKGVFVIIKNFEADLREFSQAIYQARSEGIPVKYVISHDDISVETSNFKLRHRGVAGTVLLHKIIGQAAYEGASLEELERLGLEVATAMATLGFATKPATILGDNHPMFQLEPGNISFGIGIHGEPGYRTVPFQSSEILANELINKLKMKLKWQDRESFILVINNLGATSKMEELIFTNDVLEFLALDELEIVFTKTGRLVTSLDMAGLSITLCRLQDKKWLQYLQAPTDAFGW
ncbi:MULTISPECIES: DhaKLM operon coactivator DhaQ [Streptococcus]|uniref:DhaKLM operon coactivator DhaQ n=1 Tax=Streptococcus caledonicus TaxID=2614158 RepID=A0ABW0UIH6_9STRE|nr:DhaKLM operon coactivator DhaQ [Streptococcus sp. S784/96/1]